MKTMNHLTRCAMILLLYAASMGLAQAQATTGRVFEKRTYYTHDGKLDDLLARFRNHTTRFFEKHGMTNIGYWVPREQPNTLIYVLAYPSREAATQAWAAFRKDPDWVTARTASEANGPIVVKVTSVFMDATNFSAIK